jgi:hypothetical protein
MDWRNCVTSWNRRRNIWPMLGTYARACSPLVRAARSATSARLSSSSTSSPAGADSRAPDGADVVSENRTPSAIVAEA